jgi:hypothetical protein
VIGVLTTLQHVDISGNPLPATSADDQQLIGDLCGIVALPQLRFASFAAMRLGAKALQALLLACRSASQRDERRLALDLSGNELAAPRDVEAIAAALTSVRLALVSLTLADCRVGAAGLAAILSSLQRSDRLERLDVSGNFVDTSKEARVAAPEVASAVINFLISHPALRELVLARNVALRTAMPTLLQSLKSLRLHTLAIGGIPMSDASMSALAVSLRLNRSLAALDLTDCRVSLSGWQSFRAAMRQNEALHHVRLASGTSPFEALDAFRRCVPSTYTGRRLQLKEAEVFALYEDIRASLARNRHTAAQESVAALEDKRTLYDVLHPAHLPAPGLVKLVDLPPHLVDSTDATQFESEIREFQARTNWIRNESSTTINVVSKIWRCRRRQCCDAGQLLALEQLERCAAASADVRHLVLDAKVGRGRSRIAAANDHGGARRGRLGGGVEQRLGAGGKRRKLKHTHRTVPDDGLSARQHVGKLLLRRRTDVEAEPAVGHAVGNGDDLVRGVGGKLVGDNIVDRSVQLDVVLGGERGELADNFGALGVKERGADLVMVEHFGKRKRHAAANDHFVDERQQIANELNLVGDLGAAENGDVRLARLLERLAKVVELLLQQKAGTALRQLAADHGGVRAVRGAKRVVDVNVAERRQRRRKRSHGGLVRLDRLASGRIDALALLFDVKAKILQQNHRAGRRRTARLLHGGADAVVEKNDGALEQLLERRGDHAQRHARHTRAIRSAQMRHQHNRASALFARAYSIVGKAATMR